MRRLRKVHVVNQYPSPATDYRPRENFADCDNCPLGDCNTAVPAKFYTHPVDLAVVGEAPGKQEEWNGEYFIGESGKELDSILFQHGISRNKIHINNALQCRPEKELTIEEWKKATKCCWPRLERELCLSKAKVILGLGKWAQWTLLGKTDPLRDWVGCPYLINPPNNTAAAIGLSEKSVGSLLKFIKDGQKNPQKKDTPETTEIGKNLSQEVTQDSLERWRRKPPLALVSYHPAFALRGKTAYLEVLSIHLLRAWKLATGQLKPWVWPPLYVHDDTTAKKALQKMWRGVKSGKYQRLGIDIEGGLNPVTDKMTKVGIACKDFSVSLSWPTNKENLQIVKSILAHPVAKAAHNGTHDLIGFERENLTVSGYKYDTIIQHAVYAPSMLHRLQFACCLEFHMPAWKKEYKVSADEKGRAYEPKTDDEWVEYGEYNAKDSYMTLLLSHALEERLEKEVENWRNLYEGYLRRSLISKEMRKTGIILDRARLGKHLKDFQSKRNIYTENIQEFAKVCGFEAWESLNPNSDAQIGDLVYGKLDAPATRRSEKTGRPSLDKKALERLSVNVDPRISEIARLLIEHRQWRKLVDITKQLYYGKQFKTTKLGKLEYKAAQIQAEKTQYHIIHADGQCWGTKTGRWAYRDPNLTTIPKPKKKKVGEEILTVAPGLRECVIPRPGKKLVEVDASQLELRIVGYLSNDELLIGWYESGLDVHTENSKRWFGTESPNKAQRSFAKTMVYAMNYGGSAKTIWQNLVVDYPGILLKDIQRYIDLWYMHHPAIRVWQKSLMETVREEGQIRIPLSGKVVNFYRDSPDPPKVYNPPVQGVGAFIIDEAIERAWGRLDRKNGDNLLLQVHDALVGESYRPYRMATIFKEEMERPIILEGKEVVFPADVQIGKSWGECDEISLENLNEGLKKEEAACHQKTQKNALAGG